MVPRRGVVSKLTVRDSSAMAEYWPDTMTCRNTKRRKNTAAMAAKTSSSTLARPETVGMAASMAAPTPARAGRGAPARPEGRLNRLPPAKPRPREEAEARAVREEARRGSSKERPRTRPVREASARPPRPLLSG